MSDFVLMFVLFVALCLIIWVTDDIDDEDFM